ncbi:DNA topoisomerase 2-binding protein 1 [Smittium culicis]|uniref:DNA topoisomerase 2-binding protein 1 n=1 Tax=Smittium culicis TaxID=133412 RepID=A0A1R1YAI9_9FUNG|nr:DNA topoisomerase 2-binding protein 1 [Smittium culicis]
MSFQELNHNNNGPLSGKRFTTSGIPIPERNTVYERISSLGGECVDFYNNSVHILIANSSLNSDKCKIAAFMKRPVVTTEFLSEFENTYKTLVRRASSKKSNVFLSSDDNTFLQPIINCEEQFLQIVEKHKLRVFHGCEICVTGFDYDEREHIKQIVNDQGGIYQHNFYRGCTVLVSKTTSSAKLNSAINWNIPIVELDWILDSLVFGACKDFSKYYINLENVVINKNSVPSLSAHQKSDGFPEKKNFILDKKSNNSQMTPNSIKKKKFNGVTPDLTKNISPLDDSVFPKGDIFSKSIVCLDFSNHNEFAIKKWSLYVSKNNGEIYDLSSTRLFLKTVNNSKPQKIYFIQNEDSFNSNNNYQLKKIAKSLDNNISTFILSEKWLIETIKLGKLADTSIFKLNIAESVNHIPKEPPKKIDEKLNKPEDNDSDSICVNHNMVQLEKSISSEIFKPTNLKNDIFPSSDMPIFSKNSILVPKSNKNQSKTDIAADNKISDATFGNLFGSCSTTFEKNLFNPDSSFSNSETIHKAIANQKFTPKVIDSTSNYVSNTTRKSLNPIDMEQKSNLKEKKGTIFRGILFLCLGWSSSDKNTIQDLVEKQNGIVLHLPKDQDEFVNWFISSQSTSNLNLDINSTSNSDLEDKYMNSISQLISTVFDTYEKYGCRSLYILSPLKSTTPIWVTECWLERCIDSYKIYHFNPSNTYNSPLKNQEEYLPEQVLFYPLQKKLDETEKSNWSFSISGYEGLERDHIGRLCACLGLRFSEVFNKKTTHLICKPPFSGLKYQRSLKWKTIVIGADAFYQLAIKGPTPSYFYKTSNEQIKVKRPPTLTPKTLKLPFKLSSTKNTLNSITARDFIKPVSWGANNLSHLDDQQKTDNKNSPTHSLSKIITSKSANDSKKMIEASYDNTDPVTDKSLFEKSFNSPDTLPKFSTEPLEENKFSIDDELSTNISGNLVEKKTEPSILPQLPLFSPIYKIDDEPIQLLDFKVDFGANFFSTDIDRPTPQNDLKNDTGISNDNYELIQTVNNTDLIDTPTNLPKKKRKKSSSNKKKKNFDDKLVNNSMPDGHTDLIEPGSLSNYNMKDEETTRNDKNIFGEAEDASGIPDAKYSSNKIKVVKFNTDIESEVLQLNEGSESLSGSTKKSISKPKYDNFDSFMDPNDVLVTQDNAGDKKFDIDLDSIQDNESPSRLGYQLNDRVSEFSGVTFIKPSLISPLAGQQSIVGSMLFGTPGMTPISAVLDDKINEAIGNAEKGFKVFEPPVSAPSNSSKSSLGKFRIENFRTNFGDIDDETPTKSNRKTFTDLGLSDSDDESYSANFNGLKSKILEGLSICISTRLSSIKEELTMLAEKLGATVVNTSLAISKSGISAGVSPMATHLIHSSNKERDHLRDVRWAKTNNVHIVSHHWLYSCDQSNYRLDESLFGPTYNPEKLLLIPSSSLSNFAEPEIQKDEEILMSRINRDKFTRNVNISNIKNQPESNISSKDNNLNDYTKRDGSVNNKITHKFETPELSAKKSKRKALRVDEFSVDISHSKKPRSNQKSTTNPGFDDTPNHIISEKRVLDNQKFLSVIPNTDSQDFESGNFEVGPISTQPEMDLNSSSKNGKDTSNDPKAVKLKKKRKNPTNPVIESTSNKEYNSREPLDEDSTGSSHRQVDFAIEKKNSLDIWDKNFISSMENIKTLQNLNKFLQDFKLKNIEMHDNSNLELEKSSFSQISDNSTPSNSGSVKNSYDSSSKKASNSSSNSGGSKSMSRSNRNNKQRVLIGQSQAGFVGYEDPESMLEQEKLLRNLM